jgi:hypothetical protein
MAMNKGKYGWTGLKIVRFFTIARREEEKKRSVL